MRVLRLKGNDFGFKWVRFASNKASQYLGVVGLEVHAQITTESKLFSAAPAKFGALVNSCVLEFDAAIPGTLPVLNKKCVESAIQTGLALNCKISEVTMFDRKHYFYADMPSGYQITQQRHPIAKDGFIQFPVISNKKVDLLQSKIIQIQLEQDSGKSLHDELSQVSLVDLNRAGMPLMEFVFAPDISNGSQAAALVKELCLILTKLGVSSCKMEEGALRVDANVSVHRKNEPLGVRTEVKNIGSIRGVAQAVDFEIKRQIALLETGGRVVNETRNWDSVSRKTIKMRDKEVVLDYRFMPEPNLLPLHISFGSDQKDRLNISNLLESMPELPSQVRTRLEEQFKLSKEAIISLVEDQPLLKLFEEIVDVEGRPPRVVANVLVNNLRAVYNKSKIEVEIGPISSEKIGEVVDLLVNETIHSNFIEPIFEAALKGKPISQIIEENNWKQITDEKLIEDVCRKVLADNPKLVQQYKKGKEKLFFAFMGIVAKAEDGRINMKIATDVLKRLLKEGK